MFKKKLPLIITLSIGLIALTGCIDDQKNKPAQTTPTPTPLTAMTSRQLVDQCTTDMATEYHIHTHLTIIANKQNIEVPANVGIDMGQNCMSSLHTHDASGIIHVEAPVKKDFTLGDFFYKWKQPLTTDQFMALPLDSSHALKVYVNQQEITEPENIVLKDNQNIIIDYYSLTDGPAPLPAPHTWPSVQA